MALILIGLEQSTFECINILFLTLNDHVKIFHYIGLLFSSIPRLLDTMDMGIYSDPIIGLISTMITYAILFLFSLKSYLLFFQQRYTDIFK